MMSRNPLRNRTSLVVLVASCVALGTILVAAPWTVPASRAQSAPVSVFPVPGGRVAAPGTQITFRGVPPSRLGSIVVTGSASGRHTGSVLADSDGMGGSFVPSVPFKPGEVVTVTTGLDIVGGTGGSFTFTVATPAGRIRAGAPVPARRVKGDVGRFVSRPDLQPATVMVTKRPRLAAPGDIFIAPQDGPVEDGPMILGPYGGLIWFKPVPHNDSATDFKVQTYDGNQVLTWWQGNVTGAGVGEGEDEIYNSSYLPVATVRAGNGLNSDLHEFQITAQNTALVTAYYPVYWNASSVKRGPKRASVLDAVVQEIDIPTGLVLFQWDSLDHVPLTDSYQPYPTGVRHPYDYFHVNSIEQEADGNLIVSARNTWSVYEISHQTGAIIWSLGGKHSSFKMGPNTSFAFQHDARLQANNLITIFDDGAGPPIVHKQSRGLTLGLDPTQMTATLVTADEHHPALLASYEGSVQPQPNGDDFVGWGQQPYFSEFNSHGQTVFDAHFVGSNSSYRAYRFLWSATPASLPAIAAKVSGRKPTVYASWNGATELARWTVLAGTSASSLAAVTTEGKQAFETAIRIPAGEAYVAVQALDVEGQVLGTSKTIKLP